MLDSVLADIPCGVSGASVCPSADLAAPNSVRVHVPFGMPKSTDVQTLRDTRRAAPASSVLSRRDDLKMINTDASLRCAAPGKNMINGHPSGDRAIGLLPDPTMGVDVLTVLIPEKSVALGQGPGPQPAPVGLIDLGPEPLLRCAGMEISPDSGVPRIAVTLPSVPVRVAPATPDSSTIADLDGTFRNAHQACHAGSIARST